MGLLCGKPGESGEGNIIFRSQNNFHISHVKKHAIMKSLFEAKTSVQEHGLFSKILKKIDFFDKYEKKVEELYEEILSGKIQLTNQEPLTYFEAKCYLLLFHFHFGEHDEKYKNYKENIIQMQNADSHWIKLFIHEYTHLFRSEPKYICWKN